VPEDLTLKIANWLTETGHSFEMQASRTLAESLQDTEWRLTANGYHADLETGVSRETDIELHWINGLG
jgi:hypothetical protein